MRSQLPDACTQCFQTSPVFHYLLTQVEFQETVLNSSLHPAPRASLLPLSSLLPPPSLVVIASLLSLGSSSVCALPLYVKKKKKKSSLLILWSVTRLPLCATGCGRLGLDFLIALFIPVHSCPPTPTPAPLPLPDWTHITYRGSRTELVSTCYRE